MKFHAKIAWYDMWIGAFWDAAKRVLYVCPLPCLLLKFSFGTNKGGGMTKVYW